jgi:internalin A
VSDITPLQNLTQLEELDVAYNQIADLSPLYGLQKLSVLRISHNLTPDASGFKDIAKSLKYKDFEPDKPMETAQKGGEGDQSEGPDQAGLRVPENPDKIIKFADKVLEKRIREAMGKPEGPITAGDAAKVTELYIGNEWQEKFPKGSQITKLGGIEFFINLRTLDISFHKIRDLGKLSGLTQLTYFKAFGNVIQDLKPLAGLTNLTSLNVGGNKIKSVKPLSGLQNLTELMLDQNPIKDFSPVAEIYPRLTAKDFEMK